MGVLAAHQHGPTLEINGFRALELLRHRDPERLDQHRSLVHWRDDYLGASARLLAVSPSSSPEDKTVYQQIVVAAQRDRAATLADACRAWNCCQVGGVVLLHGGNDIGIRSSAKQFAKLIGVQPEVLELRAHARVLAFAKPVDAVSAPEPEAEWITTPSDISLRTPPGVFAAGRVDRGSVVLLKALAAKPLQGIAPASVADIGCGCGILGIEALSLAERHRPILPTPMPRSCAATRDNLAACGQGQNTSVHWWDSAEDIAGRRSIWCCRIRPGITGIRWIAGRGCACAKRSGNRSNRKQRPWWWQRLRSHSNQPCSAMAALTMSSKKMALKSYYWRSPKGQLVV